MKKHPTSYYRYETARIYILWNGIAQPLGRFKTLDEALTVIAKHRTSPLEKWAVQLPYIGKMDV
jgi:hypothetical protein